MNKGVKCMMVGAMTSAMGVAAYSNNVWLAIVGSIISATILVILFVAEYKNVRRMNGFIDRERTRDHLRVKNIADAESFNMLLKREETYRHWMESQ